MDVNFDEDLLLSKKVDVNNPQPVVSQVLRIGVYDEFKAYEAYTKIMEKFGNVPPFVNIREAEAVHYSVLIPLLEKYQVEVPINDWYEKIEVPNTYVEACELGVAGEISNIAMYDNLIAHTQEQDIKDVLFRLQAASYNNHLPAFRRCVLNHYTQGDNQGGFNPDDMMNKVNEYQELFADIASGNMDQSKLTQMLSKINVSMMSGFTTGAAGAAFFNNYTNKEEE